MGGNVFKGKTRRLDKAAYEQVAAHAAAALRELYPSSKVSVIPSYGAKCDFGDLDVLISDEGLKSQEDYENLKRMTQEHFGAVGWERNGPVASVDYHKPPLNDELGFQVDLIKQDARTYEYGLAYFSFNDLGNLLGRIAHAMGVSHRHDGLYWYFRDSTYLFKEIELTIDPAKTLTFLGLPPERFAQGFDTLEDIFRYVSSSEFFRPEIYLLHNRNHVGRIRDKKRKTYMAFIDWCKTNCTTATAPLPADKSVWFERIQQFFPHFEDEHREALRQFNENRAVKEKFNGQLVSEITGLTGPELGTLMRRIRASFGNDKALIDFMLNSSNSVIRELVVSYAKQTG